MVGLPATPAPLAAGTNGHTQQFQQQKQQQQQQQRQLQPQLTSSRPDRSSPPLPGCLFKEWSLRQCQSSGATAAYSPSCIRSATGTSFISAAEPAFAVRPPNDTNENVCLGAGRSDWVGP